MFMSFINVTNSFQTYFIVTAFLISRIKPRKEQQHREQGTEEGAIPEHHRNSGNRPRRN